MAAGLQQTLFLIKKQIFACLNDSFVFTLTVESLIKIGATDNLSLRQSTNTHCERIVLYTLEFQSLL